MTASPSNAPLNMSLPEDLYARIEPYAEELGISMAAAAGLLIIAGLNAVEGRPVDPPNVREAWREPLDEHLARKAGR